MAQHQDSVGRPPLTGWIRAIREALGMTQFELGQRLGVSQPRVAQIERAEAEGSIELSTIGRAAKALRCSLHYVLVPDEPLDEMVRRQALEKADGDPALADELVDTPDLWRADRPNTPPPPHQPPEEAP